MAKTTALGRETVAISTNPHLDPYEGVALRTELRTGAGGYR